MLDRYTDNLSAEVSLRPEDFHVYGRDKEIKMVIRSLKRRSKNNPVLVGEPGVGKTAIVEGLALAIICDEVPDHLKGMTVRSLELSSLMNTEEGGNFITKFKKIIEELVATSDQNLLFIDEFHTIMGAGKDGQSLDAGNIIKSVLARGKIKIVGATTLDEFHEFIEEDRALERRTQPIMVNEPSAKEAFQIISQAKSVYESFHQVTFSENAIRQAIQLSVRYIPDRFLPDKAFDLLDEAAAYSSSNGKSIVTEVDIAEILKLKTGIPVSTILKDENFKLKELKMRLKEKIKGQDQAIDAVVDAIAISKAGLQDEDKPISSFLFLGPTGVGKTELAKTLAITLFDDPEALLRFDMSEYSQKEDVSRMIGDRKSKSKGTLTEGVKRKPYSILLIDEIEKGVQEVHDLLLQVLDAGHLTDATGRKISFKNVIVIMTTNIGAQKIINKAEMRGNIKELSERDRQQFETSMDIELQTEFRPEFLNRVENQIVFNLLDKETIGEIAVSKLEEFESKLHQQNINLSYNSEVIDYLIANGTNVKKGARPLTRLIKRKIIAPTSFKLLTLKGNHKPQLLKISVEGNAPDKNHRLDKRNLVFQLEEKNDF
ncbi:ATP-dependent Clp protease ATP-binding subunit [Streptococcus iniae]|uniref:AAA family ATPase n=1 Tax=Streptococcus iniae TaxID=1346 RepID=UPI000EF6B2F3|nr:ATP-dependent Clp protease ATP-binding subunit [Streptococcus iniae]RLV26745.1 ATP-dependent Clp protease ATP-binding subunit [Streptococcus iniae]